MESKYCQALILLFSIKSLYEILLKNAEFHFPELQLEWRPGA